MRSLWDGLSLSLRYSMAASIVVAIGMSVIGSWVSARIEEGVINNAATAANSYVEKYVAPHLQELALGSGLSAEHRQALDKLLSPQAANKPILSFRIWQGNTVVYSDRKEHIGKTFTEKAALTRAWQGAIVGEFDRLSDEHSAGHPMLGAPVLEIYAPVRALGTNRIIALAETYEIAPELRQELTTARTQSWLMVGGVTLAIIGSLFGIVHNGSRTIERQRVSLEQRVAELSRLLTENDDLRHRVNKANQRMAGTNERLLRRIGADLHDGPVQLLGLALLKLEDLCDIVAETDAGILANTDAADVTRGALTEALQEIRHLSAGLAPPDIEKLSVRETLSLAAKKHEQRTGTRVQCVLSLGDVVVPFPIKTCLYRFAQEGLNNAYQHAGGVGQALFASCTGGKMEIKIVDRGPGFATSNELGNTDGQGLTGLRDRIESLGGHFEIRSDLDVGTCLLAQFGIAEEIKQ